MFDNLYDFSKIVNALKLSTPGLLWLVALFRLRQDKVIISHYFNINA